MAREIRPMTDDELKNIVSREIHNSIGYVDSEIAEQRRRAYSYYFGDKQGNEREGSSQVVSRDVLDTVEWIMPMLMKIFAGTDKSVEFEPENMEDQEFAEQATDYINHVYNKDNNGFLVDYLAIKDGLLAKTGVVKIYWEDEEKWSGPETYTGLDEWAFEQLVSDDDVEVVEHTEQAEAELPEDGSIDQTQDIQPQDMMMMEAQIQQSTRHDVKIRRRKSKGRARVVNVPPEEFLISIDARNTIESARFSAHRRTATRSELVEMGFDEKEVYDLPAATTDYADTEKNERLDDIYQELRSDTQEESQEEVWVTEAYVKADVDGDGIAELLQVYLGGESEHHLLSWEEVDEHPFEAWSPILVPHRFHGVSIADLVLDIQEIKTTLFRQLLDNLYLTNVPHKLYVENQVNDIDSLLERMPGGLTSVKSLDAVRNDDIPFVAQHVYGAFEYIDSVLEKRTGIGGAAGLDPNVLQNATAAAVSQSMNAAQQRIELIARIYAEVFMRGVFRKLLRLTVRNQDKERVIRLRNEWVPMKPADWNADMDVTVNVGMGNGNRDMQMMQLDRIAEKQEAILQQMDPENPLVGLQEYHHTLEQMVTTAGFKSPEAFLKDPANYQPPQGQQPEPSEAEIEAQHKMQVAQMESQQKMQIEQMKAQQDAQLEQQKQQDRIQFERWKAELEAQQAREKAELDAQVEREKIQMQQTLKNQELQMEAELERMKMQAGSPDGQGNLRQPET